MPAVSFDPDGYLVKFVQPGLAKSLSALLPDGNESAFCEDLHMKRNRLTGGIEFFRQGIYIQRLIGQKTNDRPSCWIGYGLKYIPSRLHNMQVFDCKYKRKYSLAQIYLYIHPPSKIDADDPGT